MEDINLKELFIYIKKYFLVIIVMFLFFLVGSIYYCKVKQYDVYQTNTSIMVVTNNNIESDIKNITINEYLTKTFYEVIKSKKILNKVIDELELDMNYNELYNKINVALVEKTGYINIIVKDTNSAKITDIANKIVEVFKTEINEMLGENNSIINVVDKSDNYIKYSNIATKNIIIISSLAGIIIGLIIILIMYYYNIDILKKKRNIKLFKLKK